MAIVRGHLNSSEALPVTPDQVTAEWCSDVLGCVVKDLKVIKTIHGTASKIILELIYADTTGQEFTLPDRVCVKGGFDPNILAMFPGLTTLYRREAEFYYVSTGQLLCL